jgi:hypothetical protein
VTVSDNVRATPRAIGRVLKNILRMRVMDDPPRIEHHKYLTREAESGHAPDSAR